MTTPADTWSRVRADSAPVGTVLNLEAVLDQFVARRRKVPDSLYDATWPCPRILSVDTLPAPDGTYMVAMVTSAGSLQLDPDMIVAVDDADNHY